MVLPIPPAWADQSIYMNILISVYRIKSLGRVENKLSAKASNDGDLRENMAKADIRASDKGILRVPER
jgi:hypothetical protein